MRFSHLGRLHLGRRLDKLVVAPLNVRLILFEFQPNNLKQWVAHIIAHPVPFMQATKKTLLVMSHAKVSTPIEDQLKPSWLCYECGLVCMLLTAGAPQGGRLSWGK